MAAPEVPLCYVGVARESAAFRLMKQMVLSLFFSISSSLSLSKPPSPNPTNPARCDLSHTNYPHNYIPIQLVSLDFVSDVWKKSMHCFISTFRCFTHEIISSGVAGRWRPWKGQARNQGTSQSEKQTGYHRFFFFLFLPTAANVIYNICAVQMFNMCLCFPLIGVGLDKAANNWAFDTSQFDNILKRLKVVTLWS